MTPSRSNDRRAARLIGWISWAPRGALRPNPYTPRWKASSRVQTLLFERPLFSERKAKAWAKKHGFRYGSVDVTENFIRLRQENPEHFRPSTFRTIIMRDGVLSVIGVPKRAIANGTPKLLFRAMLVDDKGRPLTGIGPNRLGIRLSEIKIQKGKIVRQTPEKRGMSVTPEDFMKMPRHLLPKYLPKGESELTLFEIPVHDLPEALSFSQDKPSHGVIHPKEEISVEDFLKNLASTIDRWVRRGG